MHLHHHYHGGCAPHAHDHGKGADPQDRHRHHHHHDAPMGMDKRFAIGAAINMIFVIAELGFGFISNSLGLIADAAHNFSDVIGLLLAWGGAWLSRLNPTAERTYGYSGASILAALGNAALLFVATGAIIVQSIQRFIHPAPVESMTIIWVAVIGIVINGATVALFHSGKDHDLNVKGAYLHMIADTAVSLGVVIAGFAIMQTGWVWIDPVISLVIAGVILVGTWGLAKEALHLSLAGVPKHVDTEAVEKYLLSLPGVTEVHDLHIWGMSTTKTALTAHLLMPEGALDDDFLHKIAHDLARDYGIQHPTIQLEKGIHNEPCPFAAKDVI